MSEPMIHSSAVVDEDVQIGDGTKVWHFVHVSRGARIGEGCVLGQNVFVGEGVVVGNRVRVQNNVSIYAGVAVDDDAFLGPSCVFTNVTNPRSHVSRKDFARTHVGRGATIGANATIVCGHAIGEYGFVGAGAVVTRDVPAHALVIGNPARQAGWVCECGERLAVQGGQLVCVCSRCGARYGVTDAGCQRHEGP